MIERRCGMPVGKTPRHLGFDSESVVGLGFGPSTELFAQTDLAHRGVAVAPGNPFLPLVENPHDLSILIKAAKENFKRYGGIGDPQFFYPFGGVIDQRTRMILQEEGFRKVWVNRSLVNTTPNICLNDVPVEVSLQRLNGSRIQEATGRITSDPSYIERCMDPFYRAHAGLNATADLAYSNSWRNKINEDVYEECVAAAVANPAADLSRFDPPFRALVLTKAAALMSYVNALNRYVDSNTPQRDSVLFGVFALKQMEKIGWPYLTTASEGYREMLRYIVHPDDPSKTMADVVKEVEQNSHFQLSNADIIVG